MTHAVCRRDEVQRLLESRLKIRGDGVQIPDASDRQDIWSRPAIYSFICINTCHILILFGLPLVYLMGVSLTFKFHLGASQIAFYLTSPNILSRPILNLGWVSPRRAYLKLTCHHLNRRHICLNIKSITVHPLLWMNVMLDFICMVFAEMWTTFLMRKIQNDNLCLGLNSPDSQVVRGTRWKEKGRWFDSRPRHKFSFWIFRIRNVVHISAKTIQMKSSMTFIQSNGCTVIDLI